MGRSLKIIALASAFPASCASFKRGFGRNSAFSGHRVRQHDRDGTSKRGEQNVGQSRESEADDSAQKRQKQVDSIMQHLNDLRLSLKAQYRDSIAKQSNETTSTNNNISGTMSLESLLSEVESQAQAGLLADDHHAPDNTADAASEIKNGDSKKSPSKKTIVFDNVALSASVPTDEQQKEQESSAVNFDTVQKYLEGYSFFVTSNSIFERLKFESFVSFKPFEM